VEESYPVYMSSSSSSVDSSSGDEGESNEVRFLFQFFEIAQCLSSDELEREVPATFESAR
jgi:hypothetical protein